MWHSTIARRSKKAAMATARPNIRIFTYVRSATDAQQPRSLEAQAASVRAFIDAHPDWRLISPFDPASVNYQSAEDHTDGHTT